MAESTPELIHARPVFRPSVWIWAAIVLVLAAMFVHGLVTNPNYHWEIVWEYLFDPRVVSAVGWTLILTVAAMCLGILMAVTMAIMRMGTNPVLRAVSWAYIWFFRGTPIYTQLVFWGLVGVLYQRLSIGIPFGPEFFSFNTYDLITPAVAAILGLGLNEGAYLAEIVRGGLQSVDKGQWEAANALGMKRSTTLRRIVIPQAMRVIVPPTGNETISMLKTTSLVLAVPFSLELTFVSNAIGNKMFQPLPLLLVAAIYYLAITSILMIFQTRIEAYYGKGFDGEKPAKAGRGMSKRQQSILAAGTVHDDPTLEVTP
ncbi:polar amino acid transport system permease protein [Tessaracoccus bendigoensis DSM 12906]|uniref:Polar amino acid transport system permease protein n=2 Tax=Tessaracoccus TaxID=72763 RepID=A0A1M6IWP6_9ACTN|nr:amino acid ABC transporter permease [Tessaracoccus bendigoensis]SHJ38852.1 polar amino acid transport system permease protein [Tessaracoccus bendigoensis DSM 12906]